MAQPKLETLTPRTKKKVEALVMLLKASKHCISKEENLEHRMMFRVQAEQIKGDIIDALLKNEK